MVRITSQVFGVLEQSLLCVITLDRTKEHWMMHDFGSKKQHLQDIAQSRHASYSPFRQRSRI